MERMNDNRFAHSVGEFVMYRSNGIYRINDIRNECFSGLGEKTYYVMSAAFDQNSVIYVPVDAKDIEINMRKVMSHGEIDEIIGESEKLDYIWIENAKERADHFGDLLSGGKSADVLWLFKILSLYRDSVEKKRKKLYASDAKILASAEKLITEEFAFVLGIERAEVVPYIVSKIGSGEAV